MEEIIRSGIRQSSSGTLLNLEPAELDMIIEKYLWLLMILNIFRIIYF